MMSYFKRIGSGSTLRWVIVILFGLVVLGPLLALLIRAGQLMAAGEQQVLDLLVPNSRRITLLFRTTLYAFGVALTCFVVGGFAGAVLWQLRSPKSRVLRWLLLIMAPLPPYIHGLAWSSLWMWINSLLRRMGAGEISFRGFAASWWVESMAMLPITAGMALIGFLMIDRDIIDAARLQSDDGTWLRRIVFPLASPTLIAGSGVVFILSLIDYSVPSLFQTNVYALEIFAEFSASNEPVRSFFLGFPLWLIAVLVLGITVRSFRSASLTPAAEENLPLGDLELPIWIQTSQRAAVFLISLQILVPLLSQIFLVKSFGTLWTAVADAAVEIEVTLLIALGAALLSVPFALALGIQTLRQGNSFFWWMLLLVPITLPASLVGIGLAALWNGMLDIGIYGTLMMPILASAVRFIPFAVLISAAQMRTIRKELIESARIYQKSNFHRILRIDMPLYLPGLAAAAAMVFILAAGELGATLIVSPPGKGTLTMRIYNYLHYGASDTVAGLCLAITFITVFFGIIIVYFLQSRNRMKLRATTETLRE